MGIRVGIDLGTTYSAVAVMDESRGRPQIVPNTLGERITPSFLQFTEDGGVVVGTEAKEAFEAGEPGCASVFKRSMGSGEAYCSFYGKTYTAEDLSAILLRHLREEAERVTRRTIDEAVVTVPAYFYHRERQATLSAAKKAGLRVRQLINEPTAAAMNYGADHWRENARVLVYDLGGGTFDVTLVEMRAGNRMETLQTTGDHTLGGKDWDARAAALLEARIEEETGLSAKDSPALRQLVSRSAESVKRQLTSCGTASVRLDLPGCGKYDALVTLEEFERCTGDLLERTGALCESLLRGLAITWRDVTDVLLVGGSTRMRQVPSYLKRISGHTPLSQVNPDEAVALGAAIQACLPLPEYSVIALQPPGGKGEPSASPAFPFRRLAAKPAGEKRFLPGPVGRETPLANALAMRHADVVAHAMGVIAVNAAGTAYINKTIVPANQRIPVKCAEAFHFYTASHGDNELEIYVLQGTKPPLECHIIGKYVVSGIRHDRRANPTIIRIQYSYDASGMVHVQARQGDGEADLPVREEPVPRDMSRFGRPIDPAERTPAAEPLSLVLAVDVSGSMRGGPIRDALRAMCRFTDSFDDYPGDVRIGVIAVSDKSLIVQPLTDDLDRCRESIRSITCGMTGTSNFAHPFDDLRSMLEDRPGRRMGIVLADGVWAYQDEAVRAAKACHRRRIDIAGVGFGSADESFLRKISSGDVRSMLVKQSELERSFGRIAQEIGAGRKGKTGRAGGETGTATWLAVSER